MAIAAAIPGTLVILAAAGGDQSSVTFGHPSGALKVGAEAGETESGWMANKVSMSRNAWILMEGRMRIPGDAF